MPMSPTAPKTTAPHDSGSIRRRLAHSGVLDAWRSDRDGRAPSTAAEIAGRLRDLGRVDADLGWIGAAAAVTNLGLRNVVVDRDVSGGVAEALLRLRRLRPRSQWCGRCRR